MHRLFPRSSIRWTYPLAEARVAVSEGAAADLAEISGLDRSSFTVIYNPVFGPPAGSTDSPEVEALWGRHGARILSEGNLRPAKNHSLLVSAFARLRKWQTAKLTTVGDGEMRPALESLVRRQGLEDDVALPGYRENVWPFYRSADLFVLSSDREGYPLVMLEAMRCGLPVVSTDCRSGPR